MVSNMLLVAGIVWLCQSTPADAVGQLNISAVQRCLGAVVSTGQGCLGDSHPQKVPDYVARKLHPLSKFQTVLGARLIPKVWLQMFCELHIPGRFLVSKLLCVPAS